MPENKIPEHLNYTDTGEPQLPILFFIHGWPDTGELWKRQETHFAGRYRCVCITLPAFDPKDSSRGPDFPELLDRIISTISRVRPDSNVPLILVGHDWGAYLTYLLDQQHPEISSRLITMDVGGHFRPASLAHALFMLSYQWWLIAAYFFGKLVPSAGNAMNRLISVPAHAPRGSDVVARSNYLYFYFWRARFCKKYRRGLLQHYRISKPLLYLFGEKKTYHFHSSRWLKWVAEAPGSKAVGLKDCGHWLMLRDPEVTNQTIDAWLKEEII